MPEDELLKRPSRAESLQNHLGQRAQNPFYMGTSDMLVNHAVKNLSLMNPKMKGVSEAMDAVSGGLTNPLGYSLDQDRKGSGRNKTKSSPQPIDRIGLNAAVISDPMALRPAGASQPAAVGPAKPAVPVKKTSFTNADVLPMPIRGAGNVNLINPLAAPTSYDPSNLPGGAFGGIVGLNRAIAEMLPYVAENKRRIASSENAQASGKLAIEQQKLSRPVIKMRKVYSEETDPVSGAKKSVVTGEEPITLDPNTGLDFNVINEYRNAIAAANALPQEKRAKAIDAINQRLAQIGASGIFHQ